MSQHPFSQVDVFGAHALLGNPVAVVHGADDLDEATMVAFARWTNLSETTFLMQPTDPRADYRLRIFTPGGELPFAGHPTLGSAHAWLEQGGVPATSDLVVQECQLGLVQLRRGGERLAFRAPHLLREGAVDPETLVDVVGALGVAEDRLLGANWVDNGPGWLGLELAAAQDVLDLRPDFGALGGLAVGVIGPHTEGDRDELGADYEVRAFYADVSGNEDPVTGSLNAGLALWLTRTGRAPGEFVVRQGTALGRDGRVQVSSDEVGDIWVGGACRTLVEGSVRL